MAITPLHEQIRKAREAAGLSQQGLAEAVGIKEQSAISRWESGEHAPTVDALQRLADALGVAFLIEPRKRTHDMHVIRFAREK